jgi:hypothetical protein
MLDYVGTQLLLVAAREGAEGVETSLGEEEKVSGLYVYLVHCGPLTLMM